MNNLSNIKSESDYKRGNLFILRRPTEILIKFNN